MTHIKAPATRDDASAAQATCHRISKQATQSTRHERMPAFGNALAYKFLNVHHISRFSPGWPRSQSRQPESHDALPISTPRDDFRRVVDFRARPLHGILMMPCAIVARYFDRRKNARFRVMSQVLETVISRDCSHFAMLSSLRVIIYAVSASPPHVISPDRRGTRR